MRLFQFLKSIIFTWPYGFNSNKFYFVGTMTAHLWGNRKRKPIADVPTQATRYGFQGCVQQRALC